MRVNVYAEEMTDRVEIIKKEIDGHTFTGLRFYLELPTTLPAAVGLHGPALDVAATGFNEGNRHVKGPFVHRPGDDDSAAVTFWGKRDLREVLRKALVMLDVHYANRERTVAEVRQEIESVQSACGARLRDLAKELDQARRREAVG